MPRETNSSHIHCRNLTSKFDKVGSQCGFGAHHHLRNPVNARFDDDIATVNAVRFNVQMGREHGKSKPAPLSVRVFAADYFASGGFNTEAGQRLMSDPRMSTVWNELTKKSRSNGKFVHGATPQAFDLWKQDFGGNVVRVREKSAQSVKEWDLELTSQDMAMCLLFFFACLYANQSALEASILTKNEFIELERAHLRIIGAMKFLSDSLSYLADRKDEPTSAKRQASAHVANLASAIMFFKNYLRDQRLKAVVVKRQTNDKAARSFAIRMTEKTQLLFGKPLYSTVATTASVVLNRPISHGKVRSWCAQDPADNAGRAAS